MTTEEKIAALRCLVEDAEQGITYGDELLSAYLTRAGRGILHRAYPFGGDPTEFPVEYESLQLAIAAYLVNKRGAEGQITHSENGISRTYADVDIPASMLREVTPHCGVIGGGT